MKSLLLLNCFLFFIGYSSADNDGGCQIEGIDDEDFKSAYTITIDDTQIDTNVFKAPYGGTLVVDSFNDTSTQSYFVVAAEDGNFVLKTTEALANVDKNTPKQTGTLLLTVDCILTCINGQSLLTLRVFINDINTHAPAFALDKYEYKVPSPIMPRTDLSIYGDAIIVTDIDFSNQNVAFTIEPDDFGVSSSSSNISKDYTAVFAVSKVIQLTGNVTYTITATDSGTSPGPLSSTTTLTLVLDEANSLETPTFDKSSYGFTYAIEDNNPTLTKLDGDIKITTRKADSIKYEISEEYRDYFEVTFDATTDIFTFSPKQLLSEDVDLFVIVTLTATTDNTAVTSLVVYLPSASDETPHFSNPFYTATYNDVSDTVVLDSAIEVVSIRTPTVTISGEYSEHFSVNYDEKTKSVQLTVKTKLSLTEIKSKSFATLELTASVGDNSDTATLILSLPEHKLQFTKALYTASYKSDALDSPAIGFTEDSKGVKIEIGGTYKDYFGIKSDSTNNQWTLSVTKPLSNDILRTENEILIPLTATDDYEDTAESVVSIELPQVDTDSPKFSAVNYLADYTNDGSPSISLNQDITITNRDDLSKIKISLDSYTNNFQLTYDSTGKRWVLQATSPLTDDTLQTKKELVLTLTAEEDGNTNKGEATVIVNWIEKEAIKFSQVYYTADYPKSGTGNIGVNPEISFLNVDDQNNVVISLDKYTNNFEIKYADEKWTLNIKSSLSDTVLNVNDELLITLTATDTIRKTEDSATLVLKLPAHKAAPEFSEAYYVAEYPEDEKGSLVLQKAIGFLNVDNPANVQITVDNYADNFKISYIANKWTIDIIQTLDDAVIYHNTELVTTLTATESGIEGKGQAVLVLNLPNAYDAIAPKFSEPFYVGDYPESGTGTIELKTDIQFTNVDPTTVTISLDKYASNFKVDYNSNKWTLTIQNPLDRNTLYSNAELVATLIATETGNSYQGKAALILNLPTSITGTAPKFSDAFYVVEYPESGTGVIEFDKPLSFLNVNYPTSIKITLDNYLDNFEVKYATNTWYINIKQGLDDVILNKNAELVVTMIATETGNNEQGEATLIFNLPTSNKLAAPHFSDAYYIAEYPEKTTDVIEFTSPITFTNVEDLTKVTINLEKYTENFGISYKNEKWQIDVKKVLDTKVLEENAELVVSLIATETGNDGEGLSALVLRLPSAATGTAPKFSEPYYVAEYPEGGTGTIEFDGAIEFINVADLTTLTLSLDQYAENFDVSYESNKWQLKIKKSLSQTVLYHNTELVMTLVAKEEGNQNEGYAALVLKLPTATKATAPIFSEAYYTAEYPETGSGTIEFDTAVTFTNVEDPTKVKISVEKFEGNFEITYEKDTWHIQIKQGLSDTVLHDNVELVMTLVATEDAVDGQGTTAVILKLPSSVIGTAPKFTDAFYLAVYPDDGTTTIDFETPVQFINVAEPSDVTITLDKYADNFEVLYHAEGWYINVKKALEETVLHENVELVMTMIATSSETKEVGDTALVLKLPTAKVGTAPIFADAYYLVKYPKTNDGTIELENPIKFKNVDDITKIKIVADSYTENFDIVYDTDRWVINIKNGLEEAILQKNVELVITLIATETGNEQEGRSALVLELPSYDDSTAIEFSEAYYFAEYPITGTDSIDFETPLKFKNVDDPSIVEITLSQYSSNFEVVYDGTTWHIKITEQLDESVLLKNAELVMTLTAHNKEDDTKGYSVLVMNLPSPSEAPQFSNAYYLAEYPESGTGDIEFASPLTFENVDNPSDVQIKLDNYLDNFEIAYDSDRWYIKIVNKLDDNVLSKNVELIMTMVATETGHQAEGEATLVLKLPKGSVAPEFSDAYYLAEYVENESGIIEFETPITFLNVQDATTVKISLDNYADNFEVRYGSNRWYLRVNSKLQKPILNENVELVMTLTAAETGNANEGYSALVLKLPSAAKATAPEFEKAYYVAKYPENVEKSIEFDNAINFLNVDDPKSVSITVDTFNDNFDITYESDKWVINVKQELDSETLAKNVELVMTLTATETGNENQGYSALVLKLPTSSSATGITFSKTYYTAKYPDTGKGTVDINDAIAFYNVDDIKTVTIDVDTYQDNFKITYESNKWILNVIKGLDSDVLVKNTELVLTLTATNSADNTKDQSALVVELPTETGPIFSDAYYTAQYPKDVKDVIELENDISFKNVDDSKNVNIVLDKYTEYFDIALVLNKWYIQVKTPLDDTILNENSELVATLVATETNKEVKGYSALVIKLPSTSTSEAPEFSEPLYTASYETGSDVANIVLADVIEIVNKDDLSKITITVDTYDEYFSVIYDNDGKVWKVNVLKNIPDDILNSKTDIVIPLVATDTTNKLSGYSVIYLTLPSLDAKTPKFSKVYYTGKYEFSGNTPVVTLDTPLDISEDNLKDVTITLDNYAENFRIEYIAETKEWKVEVTQNLDEPTLNSNTEILIALTATDASSKKSDRAVLALRLPEVNTEEAPKFSSIFYSGQYKSNDGGSITLDDSIEIVNKDDLTKVKVNFDDTYKNNFEINFDAASAKWVLKVKTPLDDSILQKNVELKLTLTATEVDNSAIGQAVLILDLPLEQADLPPKFSLPHYTGTYSVKDNKGTISLDDGITVVNKERLTDISVTLDSYQTNFKVNYDSTQKQWTLVVGEDLSKDILESQRELVLTLIATEEGNDNTGESTLIVTLPSSQPSEELVKFSQVHYAAEYVTGKSDKVEVDDAIKVESKVDTKNLVISFENEEYADHFEIALESDTYVVKVLTPLPSTILGIQVSLPLTLVATLDDSKSYATLVINLPPATTDHSISFSKPLYSATYSVSSEGTVTFQVESTIEVNTDAADGDVEAKITSTTGYEQYFGFSYSNKVLTIVKTKNIPESELKSRTLIPLILTVGLSGTEDAVSSVLNVAIDFSENEAESLISFSTVLYQGKYEVTDGVGALTVNDAITVKTDEPDSNVEAIVANEYYAYFRAVYSNKVITLDLLQQIPSEVLSNIEVIPVILQVSVKGSDNPALAVVNIKVIYNSEEDPGLIEFATVLYTAHYVSDAGKGIFTVDQDIQVITDADDDQVKPSIEDSEYSKYFSVTYKSKSVSVKLESDIPEDVLISHPTIPIILTVEITGTTHRHSAVLNVISHENENTVTDFVVFSKPLYTGQYDVTDGKVTLTLDDTIEITSSVDDDNIEVIISNEYEAYFSVSFSKEIVTIRPTQNFSTEFLNTSSIIPVVLQAGIKDGQKTSAVLNLAVIFDHHEDTALLEFATFLYTGKLTVTNGKEELTLDETITVLTDAKDEEISASILNHDNTASEYFSATYSDKKVLVKLIKYIPEDTLISNPFISLSLVVNIIGGTQRSHAVLNLPVYDNTKETSLKFSDTLYNGKYAVTNGVGVLTIDDDIKVITDESDANIEVIVSNEYDGYIETSYSKKTVSISLKKQLSTEILTGVTFISVKLQASVKNSNKEASAVLNIAITYQQEDPVLIEFSMLRYTGQYSIHNGERHLDIEDIKVITDADEIKIKPSIVDVADTDYSKYFTVIYAGKTITIQMTTEIPDDILKVTRLISLIINAEIIGSTYSTSAVLDIIVNDDDAETKSVDFSELIYHGKYKVTDGNGVLTVEDKIQVDTTEDDNKVVVVVSNEYDGYFLASYSNKIVTVSLKKQLSAEILNTTVVPVTLKAYISETSYEAFAVLNVLIFYDGEPDFNSVLEFSTILYHGSYSVVGNKGQLVLDNDIKLITDQGDDNIEIGLSEDSSYKDIFNVSYSDHIVSIILNENLPKDLVTTNALVALTLEADIKGTTQRSSAVLNIEIDDSNNNDDVGKHCGIVGAEAAYISVIAILALLLLALIAAAVAFYFLRIRKRNYSNLEEEDGRVRFNKHSLKRSSTDAKPSSALEERRPTGFIFNPISEDSVDGTDSIGEPEKTRRKSVAFDDNVEKLQLEPSLEEDNVSEDDNNTTNPETTRE